MKRFPDMLFSLSGPLPHTHAPHYLPKTCEVQSACDYFFNALTYSWEWFIIIPVLYFISVGVAFRVFTVGEDTVNVNDNMLVASIWPLIAAKYFVVTPIKALVFITAGPKARGKKLTQ